MTDYSHIPYGIGFAMTDMQNEANTATISVFARRISINQLADRLHEHVTPLDEAIIYDAVDELRRRWSDSPSADVYAARAPTYRQAVADRDEFGRDVIRLRRRWRKVKRRMRRLRRSLR